MYELFGMEKTEKFRNIKIVRIEKCKTQKCRNSWNKKNVKFRNVEVVGIEKI